MRTKATKKARRKISASERARRAAQRRATFLAAAAKPMTNPNAVMPFALWCATNGFSPNTGRRILESGKGPPVVRLSARRLGIRVSDNTAWQQSRLEGGAA